MEYNTPVKSETIEIEIKSESQDDEPITIETNNSDLNSDVDEGPEIKSEPSKEPASGSPLKITDCFSVPNDSINAADAVLSSSSIQSTFNNTNDSITPLPNSVVKTEPEDISRESNAESKSNLDSDQSKIKIEPEDNSAGNASGLCLPLNGAIKTETAINSVKKENDKLSNDQSDSKDTSALHRNDSAQNALLPDLSTIASILTTSVPSTSTIGSNFPVKTDQTDDVSSSTDQKPACRYGKSCYRLNELHRKNFFHPPGSDPLKSPEKPRCKYGSRCYRKNEEHRKRFIHDKSPDNMMSSKRKRKVRNAASQTTSHVYESDSEDSLYDDEYEDSSDEFNPDDTDSDETDFDPDDDMDAALLSTD